MSNPIQINWNDASLYLSRTFQSVANPGVSIVVPANSPTIVRSFLDSVAAGAYVEVVVP